MERKEKAYSVSTDELAAALQTVCDCFEEGLVTVADYSKSVHILRLTENNNCDGSGPHVLRQTKRLETSSGPGGSAVILCEACWFREMQWREKRNKELGHFAHFKIIAWEDAA